MNPVHVAAGKNIKNVMEYKKKLDKFLHQATIFLTGFLVSILLTVVLLKVTNSYYGLLVGIILSAAYFMWVRLKNKISQKRIAAGALTAAILMTVILIVITVVLNAAFEGLAG
jgi:hypothetical protein